MEAEILDEIPAPPPRPRLRTGPPGRTDVRRPTECPKGHVGRIRIDRVRPNGPFFTRVGYRCVYREWDRATRTWVIKRHRFCAPSPTDPLPRRHPTHEHSYSRDACPTCEHTYALDEGPRAGRKFALTASEIASLLLDVSDGDSVRRATAQARRDALRYRPLTASHRGPDLPHVVGQDDGILGLVPRLDLLDALEAMAGEAEMRDAVYVDSDWDVRFRTDLLAEPEWLDDSPYDPGDDDYDGDEPTPMPGQRDRHRRHYRFEPPADPAAMVGDERFLSRSFATGAEYVDVFGPVVTAPFQHDTWPDVMIMDSQPIRRRTLITSNEVTRISSDFLCEIFAVADGVEHELILLYPAGGKDRESIKEIFASKKGAPSWIVTDGDTAMPSAIADTFPGVIHYRCEDHLRKDAEDAAEKDKITSTAVFVAISNAQRSEAHWKALRTTVEEFVPPTARALRDWINRNEDLVLDQIDLRREHPDKPRSTGGVEHHLVTVRTAFETRRFSLRNRARLAKVLDLMRVRQAHKARPEQFALDSKRSPAVASSGASTGIPAGSTSAAGGGSRTP